MKKFEINVDDIESFINGRIALSPDDAHYVTTFTEIKEHLLRGLKSINYILDDKYNKPREDGKFRHMRNAEELNEKRKEKTYAKIKNWYGEHADILADGKQKITITKIAGDTGLHFLTVRNFLLYQGEKLGLEKTYITKHVIEVLDNIFSV